MSDADNLLACQNLDQYTIQTILSQQIDPWKGAADTMTLIRSISRLSALIFFALLSTTLCADQATALIPKIENTLKKSVRAFYSINAHGGYVYYVTPDLSQRWGESLANEHTIEVQPPGTPAVGQAFLRVYNTTGDEQALHAAKHAAFALIRGQNDLGGWMHTIRFDAPKRNMVSFDDDQTQSAISFLMALDQEIDDDSLTLAVDKALEMMQMTQLKDGGWPHVYPKQGNYHDHATYNDEGINDCIRVMMEAHRYYGREELAESLRKAGRYIEISQLPPPQPGWAQQYNEYLQPAWARTFEPPSVCPAVTINNINTLIDFYLYFGRRTYLEPIPDALRWLHEIQLPNGKWARFVELGTNKPLYYDRGRIRVNSTSELSIERRTGYGYESDLSDRLDKAEERFKEASTSDITELRKKRAAAPAIELLEAERDELLPQVESILKSIDKDGFWITKNDRYKKRAPGQLWKGEYETQDRLSSSVFISNVNALCRFLEIHKMLVSRNAVR